MARPPRHLSDSEIARLIAAARRMGFPTGPLVEAMALTAAPSPAVRFMRWADIDRDAALWTPRVGRGQHPPQAVPLVADMLRLLDALPQAGRRYVFAGPTGRAMADSPRRRRILAKAAGLADFQFDDIGHTLRQDLAHPERRETLEGWSSVLRVLLAPPEDPLVPLPRLPEDAAPPETDAGTAAPPGRSS